MTWQAWVGAVLFYGGCLVLLAATCVFAWDGWRNRTCQDAITLGGHVHHCSLRHHHEPRIHRAEGRNGVRWERRGDDWTAWQDPEPFVSRVIVHGTAHNPPA